VPQTPLVSVVDDDASIRISLEALIRSLGYGVRTFESGRAFLDAGGHTDCLISDVQMPDMTGFDLQEAMNRAGRTTPVILMTAFDDEKARTRGLGLGAVCFLRKPFSGEAIVACLESALRPGRAQG
jgi:FixJ family two-component response regulator